MFSMIGLLKRGLLAYGIERDFYEDVVCSLWRFTVNILPRTFHSLPVERIRNWIQRRWGMWSADSPKNRSEWAIGEQSTRNSNLIINGWAIQLEGTAKTPTHAYCSGRGLMGVYTWWICSRAGEGKLNCLSGSRSGEATIETSTKWGTNLYNLSWPATNSQEFNWIKITDWI